VNREAAAIAHPNIALSKYWGKRAVPGNFPAVPSLSMTLSGLATRTRVGFGNEPGPDELRLNGERAAGEPLARVTEMLDRVRAAARITGRAKIETANDFPTASGLASSASGFAALAVAATRAAGLQWDSWRVSDLARRSSASAARSLFGGLVELPAGEFAPSEDTLLAARPVLPASALDLRVIVCVTTDAPKAHGSSNAMRKTAEKSRLYGAWLNLAPSLHESLKEAALAGDWMRVGELAEDSALAMHGCALAAGFSYFRDATMMAIETVRGLRQQGMPIFFTVDAGPHVKAFVESAHAPRAAQALNDVPGVLRTTLCAPGDGAAVVEDA
jgi:diphosphomevalonate decarboxylase